MITVYPQVRDMCGEMRVILRQLYTSALNTILPRRRSMYKK